MPNSSRSTRTLLCATRRRMSVDESNHASILDIELAHEAAMALGLQQYSDPATGYKVFTAASHEKRGFCCGNACRIQQTSDALVVFHRISRKALHRRQARNFARCGPCQTVLLSQFRKRRKPKLTVGRAWDTFQDVGAARQVLFWSGGKDSFLTLKALQRRPSQERITLLTTFNGASGLVPFQDTKIADVITQAQREQVDMLAIPLKCGADPKALSYTEAVLAALKPLRVGGLSFGDLHLEEIRVWRERAFSATYPCNFPLFGVPYEELLAQLWKEQGVRIRLCSVSPDHPQAANLAVGEEYNQEFVKTLPPGVDLMGENGEFHTHVYHLDAEVDKVRHKDAHTSTADELTDKDCAEDR